METIKSTYTYVPGGQLKNIELENVNVSKDDIVKFQLKFTELCEEYTERFKVFEKKENER